MWGVLRCGIINQPITAVSLYAGIRGLQKDHGSLENQDSIDTFGSAVPRSAKPRTVMHNN